MRDVSINEKNIDPWVINLVGNETRWQSLSQLQNYIL